MYELKGMLEKLIIFFLKEPGKEIKRCSHQISYPTQKSWFTLASGALSNARYEETHNALVSCGLPAAAGNPDYCLGR